MKRYSLLICLIILTFSACTGSAKTQNPTPIDTVPVTNSGPTSEPLLPETFMLMGTNWLWQSYIKIGSPDLVEIPDPNNYDLVMYTDGQMYLLADCKEIYGSYKPSGKNISFTLDTIPEIACSDGSLADLFIDYIGKVTKFEFRDNNLILWAGDEAKLTFINGGPAGD